MATYNGSRYVAEQLASIMPQLREGDEILVADDGSTDGTVSKIRSFGDAVRIIATERVGGVVPNFERVILAATGDCIVLSDQDDVWLPGRLDLIRDSLEQVDLVVLNGQLTDESLHPGPESVFEAVGVRKGFIANLIKNSFVGSCMAFRSTLRDRVVPFPPGVPWHDWYIGLVACATGRIHHVHRTTMYYRRHAGNASPTGARSPNSLRRMFAMRVAVLRAAVIAIRRAARVPVPVGATAGVQATDNPTTRGGS
jgi:glycosyltransferase involved in cell wall biosynthesis